MATDHRMTETVSVRLTKVRYKELRRIAKANGHTISWLLNYAMDVYFDSLKPNADHEAEERELIDRQFGGSSKP